MDIGKKIRDARRSHKLSQEQLTDLCGWEHQSRISGYETGKREPSLEDIRTIALALGYQTAEQFMTTPSGLIGEADPAYSSRMKKVPLISWVAAGGWCGSDDPFAPGQADEWLECPFPHSENSFCLKVIGDSMAPDYREGEIILVDPGIDAGHGDDVVARTPESTYTFKRLQITPEGTYLLALNPDYPGRYIRIPPDSDICGVVTGSWIKRR